MKKILGSASVFSLVFAFEMANADSIKGYSEYCYKPSQAVKLAVKHAQNKASKACRRTGRRLDTRSVYLGTGGCDSSGCSGGQKRCERTIIYHCKK